MTEAALEQIDRKGYDKPFLSGGREIIRIEGWKIAESLASSFQKAALPVILGFLFPGRGDAAVVGKSGVYRGIAA